MIAVLETDRPVGEGALHAALRRVERVIRVALGKPYPRLTASLVDDQLIKAAAENPDLLAGREPAHAQEDLVANWRRGGDSARRIGPEIAVHAEQLELQGRSTRHVEDAV